MSDLIFGQRRREPLWDELVFLPAQLSRPPLLSPAEAETETIVGGKALVPLKLKLPVIVSHMDCGFASPELKLAAARAASAAGTAIGGGEGGVLKGEMELSSAYIYEYTPGLLGLTPEVLDRCAAVEIKIGRSDRGPLGEALPPGLDDELYLMRGVEPGSSAASAGRFAEISSPSDLKIAIDGLREGCGGKPVGVKLAAGRVEDDLDFALKAGADFVTLDGRSTFGGPLGGGCLPTLYAVSRARRFLKSRGARLDIIAAGGLRTAADFAKALALGATAVASASAVIEALGEPAEPQRLERWFASLRGELALICAYTGCLSTAELSPENLAGLTAEVCRGAGVQPAY